MWVYVDTPNIIATCVVDSPFPSEDVVIENGAEQYLDAESYDITLTSKDGSKFISGQVVVDLSPFPDRTYNMTVSADRLSATYYVDFSEGNEAHISAVLEASTPTPSISGTFNNLYEIDNTGLRQLRNKVLAGDDTGALPENYIINVVRIPLKVADELKEDSTQILVGLKTYDITSKKVNTDSLTFEMGKIYTPKKYSNSYDFLNTNCILHLPYSENVEVEPTYVIGETLTVTYEISLYDGVGTINVSSSKIDDVIVSVPVKIGIIVPYFNPLTGAVTTKSPELISIYNKLKRAYMEVIRNKPANLDNPFNAVTTKIAKLGDLTGFVKVNNVLLESSAIAEEKDMIVNLLNQGVIIK